MMISASSAKAVLLGLALCVCGVRGGRTYTVTSEADFYATYYQAVRGDTVLVACHINQGLFLDHGGMFGNPITVAAKGGQTIGQDYKGINVTVQADYVALVGFNVECPLYVNGQNDVVDQVRTEHKVVVGGRKNVLSNMKMREVVVNGTGNTLTASTIGASAYAVNTPVAVNGKGHRLHNNTIYDNYNSNTWGYPVVSISGDDAVVEYNALVGTARSSNRNMFIWQTAGDNSVYARNTGSWAVTNGDKLLVYVHDQPGSTRVCATNTVNYGAITNIPVDRRC